MTDREKAAKYRDEHREEYNAYHRAYYQAHKTEHRIRTQLYDIRHREHLNECRRLNRAKKKMEARANENN